MIGLQGVQRKESKGASEATIVDGRYVVVRELGRGGMGHVYLAHDIGLDRTVALKMIDPGLARHPEVIALFRREGTALARVRSDHVVQAYSLGVHEGSPFLAMEYVGGADLSAIISSYAKDGGVVPLPRAATILRQSASGLAAVHAEGIIHRDIKPSNVVVEARTGRPVLIDFGLAQGRAAFGDAPSSGQGTPLYMAPEQWVPESVISPATDVYGFGVMAFELLTGRPPFVADVAVELMAMHMSCDVPRVSTNRPSIAALDAVIARALAKTAAGRFHDAGALLCALDRALRALPDGALDYGPAASVLVTERGFGSALIVDDDESFRAFAGRALTLGAEGTPLAMREAGSGEVALEMARREMPDLLVLDFDMPGLNGLETLSRLRALPHGSDVRVLVVSGDLERVGRWQFDVMGVVDFVSKPVALRELAAVVRRMRPSPSASPVGAPRWAGRPPRP